jgi:predicted oxidoreductase
MGVDHIDLLLVHRPDPLMDHWETGAALDMAVKSGKVRSVGVSNFKSHDWTLLQSAMQSPLVTNQIEISVLENSAFTNGDLAFLQERNVPAMAWSPLTGGALFAGENSRLLALLSDLGQGDAAAAAVAWLLAHPSKIVPVLGTNNLNRIKKLGSALNICINRETWFEIYTCAIGQEVA